MIKMIVIVLVLMSACGPGGKIKIYNSDTEAHSFYEAIKKNPKVSVKDIEKFFVDKESLSQRDPDGFTPLIAAAYARNNALVKYLLEKKANPDEVATLQDKIGYEYPALLFAVTWCNAPMVHDLLEANANPRKGPTPDTWPMAFRAVVICDSDVIEEFIKKDPSIAKDKHPKIGTLLHSAAQGQNAKTLEFLLDHGADKSITDGTGKTPWDYANAFTRNAVLNLKPF